MKSFRAAVAHSSDKPLFYLYSSDTAVFASAKDMGFDGVFVIEDRRVVGGRHARLVLRAEHAGTTVAAIAFDAAAEPWFADAARIHAYYKLDVNDYGGLDTVQLVIEWATAV